jgi:hypothetical protein
VSPILEFAVSLMLDAGIVLNEGKRSVLSLIYMIHEGLLLNENRKVNVSRETFSSYLPQSIIIPNSLLIMNNIGCA